RLLHRQGRALLLEDAMRTQRHGLRLPGRHQAAEERVVDLHEVEVGRGWCPGAETQVRSFADHPDADPRATWSARSPDPCGSGLLACGGSCASAAGLAPVHRLGDVLVVDLRAVRLHW